MYDRAPRLVSDQLVGSTPHTVGPGTYELPKNVKMNNNTVGYAPFLSLAGRKTIFNVPEQEVDDPGPGTYNPSLPQQHVKGGRTLANRELRFTDTEIIKENTPGPGRYNIRCAFQKKTDEENATAANKKFRTATLDDAENITVDISTTKSGRPQKILTASLRSDINSAYVPSIPSPGQAHGFIERKTGSLVKQKGPSHDRSMGPAYYNPNHKDTKTTVKYKGVHFGRQTSQRTQFKGLVGPAPCDYTTITNSHWERSKEKIGVISGKVFESRLPRYHQIVENEETKRGVPGPGRYDIKSQFNDRDNTWKEEEDLLSIINPKRPPFGAKEARFLGHDKKTPAPGSYNDPRNALEALKKISGMKRSPFGQTSVRFKQNRSRSVILNNTPGPGTYNILNYGMSADSQKRAKKSSKTGGFGSTSVRIAPMIDNEASEVPGPAWYTLRNSFSMRSEPNFQSKSKKSNEKSDITPAATNYESFKDKMTSSFASHTARLDAPTTRTKLENPPPGSYEVAFSYEKTQSRGGTSSSKPRNQQAYLRQRSFLSHAPRFGKMNVYMPGQLPVDSEISVSAASYTPKSEGNVTKLALIAGRDERFKNIKNTTPGPGTYHLSPLIDSTVLKGTYNVTLNNPVPSKGNTTAPTEHTETTTDASNKPETMTTARSRLKGIKSGRGTPSLGNRSNMQPSSNPPGIAVM